MTTPVRLAALSAGVGVPSSTRMLTDQLVAATREALQAAGHAVEVRTVELREHAHRVIDMTLTRFPAPELAEVIDDLRGADAVIAVTPTFNTSYSGLFKSFFDVLDEGTVAGKPMLLGATGGTARHSLAIDYALRPMMAYLKADVLPTTVFAATEDFGAATTAEDEQPLATRVTRAGRELADRVLTMSGVAGAPTSEPTNGSTAGPVAAAEPADGAADTAQRTPEPAGRARRPLADEFADFVPMGDLLTR